MDIEKRLAQYAPVQLTADLSALTPNEHKILHLLIEAARAMDEAFWIQAYGDPGPLLETITDSDTRQYVLINYGPWDANRDDEPFITGVGAKPPGANFYPSDMSVEEFEASAAVQPDLLDRYTMVRREPGGSLTAVPYHQFFQVQVQLAAEKLSQAAGLIDQPGLKAYLASRADALLTDAYRDSDIAWMDMKDNTIDILIGPMETSADRWFGLKAAYAGTILVKDHPWSQRLSRYTQLLPHFQTNLPVPAAYKSEQPGLSSDLNVYDILYCAGYDRASVPLGVNWPEDDEVRLRTGTRSLQLKNAMQAKFDHLVAPIADLLISSDQRSHVTFDAYFNFVMFHELAHGLGIRRTVSDHRPVKDRLKDLDHVIEEGKANLVSLVIANLEYQAGDLSDAEIRDFYASNLAHLLRMNDSRQAIVQLNFFKEMGAYSRDPHTRTYRVHPDRMQAAAAALAERLLRIQGDGSYAGAKALVDGYGAADDDFKADIQRFYASGHPVEITLVQE